MSESLRPQGLQPTRLPCPWNSPGKNTWRGFPCSSPGALPSPGIEPGSSALWAGSLPFEPRRKPGISGLANKAGFNHHLWAVVTYALTKQEMYAIVRSCFQSGSWNRKHTQTGRSAESSPFIANQKDEEEIKFIFVSYHFGFVCITLQSKIILVHMIWKRWSYPYSFSRQNYLFLILCLKILLSQLDLWVRNIPWSRKQQPTPFFLCEKFHGQRSLEGYHPRGRTESDMIEWLSTRNTGTQDLIFFFFNLKAQWFGNSILALKGINCLS